MSAATFTAVDLAAAVCRDVAEFVEFNRAKAYSAKYPAIIRWPSSLPRDAEYCEAMQIIAGNILVELGQQSGIEQTIIGLVCSSAAREVQELQDERQRVAQAARRAQP